MPPVQQVQPQNVAFFVSGHDGSKIIEKKWGGVDLGPKTAFLVHFGPQKLYTHKTPNFLPQTH